MLKSCLFGLLAIGLAIVLAPSASAYNGTYVPGAGINNTPHDLGTPGANGMLYPASPADTLTRKCIWCHAPHNTYRLAGATGGAGPQAPTAFNYLPLWNHEPHRLRHDVHHVHERHRRTRRPAPRRSKRPVK